LALVSGTAGVAQPIPTGVSGPVGTEACVATDVERCEIAPGVSYWRVTREGERPLVMHVSEIDLSFPGLSIAVTPEDRSGGLEYRAQTATRYLAKSGAVLAVNASYFLPFVGGSRGGSDFVPQDGAAAAVSGAVISRGQTVSPPEAIDARVDSMICFAAGRAIIVEGQACPPGFDEGVSAGPRILADGEYVPRPRLGRDGVFHGATTVPLDEVEANSSPEPTRPGGPRTVVALNAAGDRMWLIVADGRQPGWSNGATDEDITELLREVGAHQAMSLDGGGSATMVARGPTGPVVLSRPIHTGVPGRQRPLGNHIGVFIDGANSAERRELGALLPALKEHETPRLTAVMEAVYTAPEARQGVAVDAEHFYPVVNTVIGKYRRADGRLVARWAGPRGGLIRHLNSCTVVGEELVCANSNHPEVPMGSSVEIFDTRTMEHTASYSLGMMDEGSLTFADPAADGWLLGFAHYSDETGVPFKSSDYSSIVRVDDHWRRTGGWLIPPAIRKRMAPQAASGGAIGPDGLLYLFGHTLPELYVLAKPSMGPELIHVATIDIDAAGQAFAFDPLDDRRIFAIDRPTGEVRVFRLPEITALPEDARLFEVRQEPVDANPRP
tara:strand:+ start:6846 stop:8678 length:1833 start_codon:yes stop_codon:yes gene_type:complete